MPKLELVHSVDRPMSQKLASERQARKRDRLDNLRRWEEHKQNLIENHGYETCGICNGYGWELTDGCVAGDSDYACGACEGTGVQPGKLEARK